MDDLDADFSYGEYLRECALGEAAKNGLDPDRFLKLAEDGGAFDYEDPEEVVASLARRLAELSVQLDGDFGRAASALAESAGPAPLEAKEDSTHGIS